jgi:hypothetical protein
MLSDEMTNSQKAEDISKDAYMPDTGFNREDLYDAAMDMAQWKDEEMWKTINLILDAIDHAYLETNGGYGDLSIEVVDKVKYLKKLRSKI